MLATGGAGHVLRAVQEPLGRQVAVKVLRGDIRDEARREFEARFLREAALAGRLSHPNVVTVHDYGVGEGGVRFVVMELLEGRTLKDALSAGPLPPTEAARLGEGIATGLRHAHRHGLVHRDVKPSNIFLVPDDEGRERPMLVDFGLVRGTDAPDDTEVTSKGTFMGTPAYMSPEQARGEEITDRADVYSLGCLLYRMLAGALPFRSDSAVAIALSQVRDPYPPMRERADVDVDPALEAIVRRCMEKRPSDRPDAGQVVEALRRWRLGDAELPDGTLSRPPAPAPDVPRRRARWGVAIASAVVGIALVCGGAVGGALLFGAKGISEKGTTAGPDLAELVRPVRPDRIDAEPIVPAGEPEADATSAAAPARPVQAAAPDVDPPPSRPPEPPAPPSTPAPPAPPAAPAAAAPAPSAPASPPEPARPVWVDGVRFSADHAVRALAFLNTASEDELRAAGLYGRGIGIVLRERPFDSLEAFGATPYIGEKSVLAVARSTE